MLGSGMPSSRRAQQGTVSAIGGLGSGWALATASASGVSQWLLAQPILTCSTGPVVLPSQNRSVIWADEPHWGQGMVSRMQCVFLTWRPSVDLQGQFIQ
jgi:hypothetical protein